MSRKTSSSKQSVRTWFSGSRNSVRDSSALKAPLLDDDMDHKLSHELGLAAGNGIGLHHTPTKRISSQEIDIELGNSGQADESNTDGEVWTRFKLMTWNLWCIPISSPRCLSNPDRCSTYLRDLAETKNWASYDGLIVVALQEFGCSFPRVLSLWHSVSPCLWIGPCTDYGVGKPVYSLHSSSASSLSWNSFPISVCPVSPEWFK